MPEVEVEGAAVSSFSLAELTLDIFLSVDNPYPVSITLQSVSFDVYYLNGNEFAGCFDGQPFMLFLPKGSKQKYLSKEDWVMFQYAHEE